ncbi:MAG: RNA polymerase sigma factor [Leptospirales bacterium]|nr:RNA polymerase sigma factor [Leptospirales bacterium]
MTSPIDDIEIVEKTLNGDVESFSLIVEKYKNMTFRYVYTRFNNYDDAMDITQDIFIMALEALKNFRRESKFSTWFYSIMVNYCKNYRKKNKRYNTVPISGGVDDSEYELQISDERIGPEEKIVLNDSIRIVKEEIYNLPDDYREVLILRDIEGMSYNDISDMVGIKLSNVKVRIHRGRELLKNRLSERGLI